jgi:hypothetical protein
MKKPSPSWLVVMRSIPQRYILENGTCLIVPQLSLLKATKKNQTDAKVDELYRHIGKLKVKHDFLLKKLNF